ncbi:hypothetical protein AFLA_012582 [Aspergillus flavus NRRL3357]|nr:hypothetical protein AFLA_012582 [Aspergillus flavus NRRL3357]
MTQGFPFFFSSGQAKRIIWKIIRSHSHGSITEDQRKKGFLQCDLQNSPVSNSEVMKRILAASRRQSLICHAP